MPECQVTYRFDKEAYTCFKAACLRRQTTPTVVVGALISEQMARWGEPARFWTDPPSTPDNARIGRAGDE